MNFDRSIVDLFNKRIFDLTGNIFAESDFYRLETRLKKIVLDKGLETPTDVFRLITSKQRDDIEYLIEVGTNHETSFFRDRAPFEALKNELIPGFIEKDPFKLINIWSAGCSTGQEVYSILSTLKSHFESSVYNRIQIDASDISPFCVKRARDGIYSNIEVNRGNDNDYKVPVKAIDNDLFQVDDDLRFKPRFFEFNLLESTYPYSRYDIIFCRNVLIYHTQENKNKVFSSLYRALKDGGYLILGNGESLIGWDSEMEMTKVGTQTVYRKKAFTLA